MSYSKEIASRIVRFLEDDDWKFKLDEDREVIKSGLTMDNKMKKVDILFDLRDDKFLLFMTFPLGTDEDERPEMCVLLNRINYNLMFGNFEMDSRDGEVRFRMSVDCDNCLPSQEVIRHAVYRSAATCSKYGNAIVQVMMGFASADEAYAAAQNKD